MTLFSCKTNIGIRASKQSGQQQHNYERSRDSSSNILHGMLEESVEMNWNLARLGDLGVAEQLAAHRFHSHTVLNSSLLNMRKIQGEYGLERAKEAS